MRTTIEIYLFDNIRQINLKDHATSVNDSGKSRKRKTIVNHQPLTDKDKWNEFSTLLYCLVHFIRFAATCNPMK